MKRMSYTPLLLLMLHVSAVIVTLFCRLILVTDSRSLFHYDMFHSVPILSW